MKKSSGGRSEIMEFSDETLSKRRVSEIFGTASGSRVDREGRHYLNDSAIVLNNLMANQE
jgi:hypothetical protein